MMNGFGQETKTGIPFYDAERPPTSQEMALWLKAEKTAKKVNLLSYLAKQQYTNLKLTHEFATANKVELSEPELPDLIDRMYAALSEIEELKDRMCSVNQLDLGIRISSNGNDLDIVQPQQTGTLGWVIPAVIGAAVVIGIIARWAHLEVEVSEITNRYNGILKRSDMALCKDPNSDLCKNWQKAKSSGGYDRRTTIIESVKDALVSAGTAAKKGLGAGIALLIPFLAYLYLPRKKG